MKLKEVGLEVELFLLNKNNQILEPSIFGFPSDEMGFLIEVRSHHSNTGKSVLESLKAGIDWNKRKADKLGLTVDLCPFKKVDGFFQKRIAEKYHHDRMPDQTRNIYGRFVSHHTGLHDGLATAGMHVHFSTRDINLETNTSRIVELPVERIVRMMDDAFPEIEPVYGRIKGEYELKCHGFEYRSLPCNAKPERVVKTALSILNEEQP